MALCQYVVFFFTFYVTEICHTLPFWAILLNAYINIHEQDTHTALVTGTTKRLAVQVHPFLYTVCCI